MSFRVVVTAEVEEALERQTVYLREQGTPTDRLDQWLAGLFSLVDSLYEWPRRYPVAQQVSEVLGYETRRANYGEYAILFRVDDREGVVEVMAFRHGRQRSIGEAAQNTDSGK